MIIEVPKVSPEGSIYSGDEPAECLELGGEQRVRVDGPIHYEFFAQVVSGELIVRGTLSAAFSLQCSRCADFFSTSIRDSSFLRAYEVSENVEVVDLTPDIREDILIDIPAYPVCSSDCKGLCPQCGTNLNAGACSCEPPAEKGQWGGLDGLKLP